MSDTSSSQSSRDKKHKQALAEMLKQKSAPLPPAIDLLEKPLISLDHLPEPQHRTAWPAPEAPRQKQAPSAFLPYTSRALVPPPNPLAETAANLRRAELINARERMVRPSFGSPPPATSLFDLFWGHPWLIVLGSVICIAAILLLGSPRRTVISSYGLERMLGRTISQSFGSAPVPLGEHSVLGTPTMSAAAINAVLQEYNSPAANTGRVWVEMGERYGIDPAYALAFFIHESSAGTNPGWAGQKSDGSTTHNIGNIICAGYARCYGRFRDYTSWEEGIEDWYKLISREYVGDRGIQTVEQIIPIYAPTSDNNDVSAYVQAVITLVDEWRR